MPVQFYNLGFHLAQADASQQLQTLHQQAARAGGEVVQGQDKDKAKEEAGQAVQDTKETENKEISGDSRGAHSHTLTKEEKEKKKEPTSDTSPEDPDGRGRVLDFEA